MKRNFLLMLLLTLLPLAGWADPVPVKVKLSSSSGPVNSALPTVSVVHDYGTAAEGSIDANLYEVGSWYFGATEWNNPNATESGDYTISVTLKEAALEDYYFEPATDATATFTTSGDPVVASEVELQVEPKTTCQMEYGDVLSLTKDMITLTPINAPSVAITADLKTAVAAMLIVNEDLSKEGVTGAQGVPFTIGFKDPTKTTLTNVTGYANTTFNLSPIGDGRVKILQGQNELTPAADPQTVPPTFVFGPATGLKFNGTNQELVVGPDYSFTSWGFSTGEEAPYGKGTAKIVSVTGTGDDAVVEIKVLTNKRVGGTEEAAQAFVGRTVYIKADPENIPAGRLQLFEKNASDELQPIAGGESHDGIFVEIAPAPWAKYAGTTDRGVDFYALSKTAYDALFEGDGAPTKPATPAGYEVPATAWDTEIPTGLSADEYYIWAKAIDGASNFKGGTQVYLGEATIAKGTPKLRGDLPIEDVYFTRTGEGSWKGIHKEIKFAATDHIYAYFDESNWTQDVTSKVVLYYQTGTKTADGGFSGHGDWKILGSVDLTILEDENAAYQVAATIKNMQEDNNLTNTNVESQPRAIFTVAKPTLTLHTTATPAAVAYGTEPVFDYTYADNASATGDWQGYKGKLTPPAKDATSYKWYTDPKCETEATYECGAIDSEGNYKLGTYFVRVDVTNGFTVKDNTHAIVVEPVAVTVGQTDIYARIEPQDLIYGQNVPLTLKYDSGDFLPGSNEVKAFESAIRNWNPLTQKGLTATLVEWDGNDYKEVLKNGEPVKYPLKRLTNQPVQIGWNHQVWPTTILPVGTYKVTADLSSPTDARKILVGSAIWTVSPKDIADADADKFRNDAAGWYTVTGLTNFTKSYTYTGLQIKPTVDEIAAMRHDNVEGFNFRWTALTGAKDGVENPDYEITAYGENINAGENAGSFTVVGKGNFKGQATVYFDIDKATVTVKPEAGNMKVGDKTESFDIDWADLLSKLVKPDQHKYTAATLKEQNGFRKLAVKRTAGNTTWGEHPQGLEAYKTDKGARNEEFAQNYNFEYGTAPLSIAKGLIKLQVKAQTATYNGKAEPVFATDFEVANKSALNSIVVENWKSVITLNNSKINFTNTLAKDAKDRYLPGSYKINVTTDADWYTSTNYEAEIIGTEANLTVNKADLKLTANSFNVTYTESQAPKFVENHKKINSDNITAVSLLCSDDKLEDIVTSINIAEPLVAGKNDITLTTKAADQITFYNVVENKAGVLTIAPLQGIKLFSEEDKFVKDEYNEDKLVGGDWKTLLDNNGKPVDNVTVYIKQGVMTTGSGDKVPFEWKADEWQALVLPFAVNTRDISRAFGYAIVNVVDAENTVKDNVKFKFMKISQNVIIPANTPFVLKTDWDVPTTQKQVVDGVEREGYPAVFDQQASYTITLPTDADGKPVKRVSKPFENEWGYTIDGTYEAMPITGEDYYLRFLGMNKWNYIIKDAAAVYSMQPYYGFVNLGKANEVRSVTFTFEEEDGSTTAIKAIDFMNGTKNVEGLYNVNGMKIQGAPTQKGIYIQNGKKFVVK